MYKYLLLLIALVSYQYNYGQSGTNTENIWDLINKIEPNKKEIKNPTELQKSTFHLNINKLKKALLVAPLFNRELGFSDDPKNKHTILQMPMPDGGLIAFWIAEAPVMHPHLAIHFPSIKAYIGIGVADPTLQIRFDVSPLGLHAMIMPSNKKMVFIEPDKSNKDNYSVFYKEKNAAKNDWGCAVIGEEKISGNNSNSHSFKTNTCEFTTFRLALACTGEYGQIHGGTKEMVLSAMHTTLTRLNGVFESELSIHLELIPNNDLLIFLNPYNDPYSNTNGTKMLEENQETIDAVIGNDNYDIGHVFSTLGGGVAQLESTCKEGLKARGVTGSLNPMGDAFDIDYVAHEFGHQFGARHTHNNNCNRNNPTAVEPGSGSSIMSYAGICAPNVQSNSDAYFHSISLAEIRGYLENGGASCAVITNINSAPYADAGMDYTIPKSTPFRLKGTGYDDGTQEGLVHAWEQIDNQVAVMPPVSANKVGPLFRSMIPNASSDRYFPSIQNVLSNEQREWEVLPSSERNLNFRYTVRDHSVNGGCVAMDDMTLEVSENAGPFTVQDPQPFWVAGTSKKINWDVAATNEGPINCQKVDILLSIDSGENFQYVLAANVPNVGEFNVIVPNIKSSKCRIKIEGRNNVFYNVNKNDFKIILPADFNVALEISDVKCSGGNTGKITANALGFENPSFYWNTGDRGKSISNLNAGNYSVTVSEGERIFIASGVVKEPESIRLNIDLEEGIEGDWWVLKANSMGGTGGLRYDWGDGKDTAYLKIWQPGTYSVLAIDENECMANADRNVLPEEIGWQSNNFKQENKLEFPSIAFPNPTYNSTRIKFYQRFNGGPTVKLFNDNGLVVSTQILLYKEKGVREFVLDFAHFKDGVYFLKIIQPDSSEVIKISKM